MISTKPCAKFLLSFMHGLGVKEKDFTFKDICSTLKV